jgi:hypothetical protein
MVALHTLIGVSGLVASLGCGQERRVRDVKPDPPTANTATRGQPRLPMTELFERALAASGAEYLALERELRERWTDAELSEALATRAAQLDPLARLLAKVLRLWRGEQRSNFDNVLLFLKNHPVNVAQTPMSVPRPDITAGRLSRTFGASVAPLLSLRLAKEGQTWPVWQIETVLLYLGQQRQAEGVPGVIRFASLSPHEEVRDWAREALAAIRDPALNARIKEAEAWSLRQNLPFPPDLAAVARVR